MFTHKQVVPSGLLTLRTQGRPVHQDDEVKAFWAALDLGSCDDHMSDEHDITTIADAVVAGKTHLRAHCSRCGYTTDIPWRLLGEPTTTVIAGLAPRMACRRCGPDAPSPTLSATSQHDASGYAEPWRGQATVVDDEVNDLSEHFIQCSTCGGWIDCRDLNTVMAHDGPLPHPASGRPN